jgi:hypothetical protein
MLTYADLCLVPQYLEHRYPGEFAFGKIDGSKNEVPHFITQLYYSYYYICVLIHLMLLYIERGPSLYCS